MALREVVGWGVDPATQETDAGGFPGQYPAIETPLRLRQVQASVQRWIQDAISGKLLTAGTPTAYTLAVTSADADWANGPPDGSVWMCRLHVASGENPTLKIATAPARAIVWPDSTVPTAGTLLFNMILTLRYVSLTNRFVIVNPNKSFTDAVATQPFEDPLVLFLQG